MSVTRTATTRGLASFLARLRYEDIPDEAVGRTKELFLDWVGSALAGRDERPVRILERFAQQMGPSGGPSEDLVSRRRTTALFAALVNGAASHVVEQDDLHNASVFHPGTVVFPAALAAAQQTGASGWEFLAAAVAGYEAGVRVGSFLGRTHYRVFHTTGTAGTLAAAAAVSHVLGADEASTLHALGSAGTAAECVGDGRWFVDRATRRANGRAVSGPLHALLPPATIEGAEPVMAPIPNVGEHTDDILAEIGYDEDARCYPTSILSRVSSRRDDGPLRAARWGNRTASLLGPGDSRGLLR